MRMEVSDLSRRFADKWALNQITFACGPGEIIAIVGNNGAGKSTLLHLLGGFLAPTRGSISIDHQPISRRDEDLRRRIAFLSDFPSFLSNFTVRRQIAMVCALHGVAPDENLEERAVSLMETAGIHELATSRIAELSRGEVYKLTLVGALLTAPDLWLLDEPMAAGMDPRGLGFLRRELQRERDRGATILYTTQIAEIAEKFADRVLVLRRGDLVAFDTVESLCRRENQPSFDLALQALTDDAPLA